MENFNQSFRLKLFQHALLGNIDIAANNIHAYDLIMNTYMKTTMFFEGRKKIEFFHGNNKSYPGNKEDLFDEIVEEGLF